jgi:hypothetical protein
MQNKDRTRKRRGRGGNRELKTTLAIFCEGQTEYEYFNFLKKEFRLPQMTIIPIKLSNPGNSLTLAKEAIRKKKNDYDQNWIVFDKDDSKDEIFEKSIELLKENSIKVAYSIRSFEIWILNHFQVIRELSEKHIIEEKINDHLKGCKYGKSKEVLTKVFFEIKEKIPDAIHNSKLIWNEYEKSKIVVYRRKGCTTIFQLIEALNIY